MGTGLLHALASEFEGVASSQFWVTLLVMTLFGALVILATYLASRRAAYVNPASAMRVDSCLSGCFRKPPLVV